MTDPAETDAPASFQRTPGLGDLADWRIDNSTPSPILTYQNCSVIQDEQADAVLALVRAAAQAPVAPASDMVLVPREPTEATGLRRAIDFIEKRRDDFMREVGVYDYSTNAVEMSDAAHETVGEWDELIEAFRFMIAAAPSVPARETVKVRPEDTAEQYIQAAVDSAPEPLRRLGEWLANKLDEDDWKTAERMLLGAAMVPAPAGEAVAGGLSKAIQRFMSLFVADGEPASLSVKDIDPADLASAYDAVAQALAANAGDGPAGEAVAEPVAWRWRNCGEGLVRPWTVRQSPVEPQEPRPGWLGVEVEPLFTHPAPAQPAESERAEVERLTRERDRAGDHIVRLAEEKHAERKRAETAEAALTKTQERLEEVEEDVRYLVKAIWDTVSVDTLPDHTRYLAIRAAIAESGQ